MAVRHNGKLMSYCDLRKQIINMAKPVGKRESKRCKKSSSKPSSTK